MPLIIKNITLIIKTLNVYLENLKRYTAAKIIKIIIMIIAGVDEVGRGPLAGPVVTAVVILDDPIEGLDDSKALTPAKRKQLSIEIKNKALAYAFGRAEVHEIDNLNIHHATLLAMKRAIEALTIPPDKILIDGIHIPDVKYDCYSIVKGDSLIQEISAASILAKVHRDEEMVEMDKIFPVFQFAKHKGYATAIHQNALKEHGPCVLHRKRFIKRILQSTSLTST